MDQMELPNLLPNSSKKRYVGSNNEVIVVQIDTPLEELATAMLTLANFSELLTTSRNEDVQSNSELQRMEALLSFGLLETVSRTMNSYVPVRTLTSIWKALARTSLSKTEVQLMRKLLRECELMQEIPLEE